MFFFTLLILVLNLATKATSICHPPPSIQMIEVNFANVAYSLFLAHFWFEVVLYRDVV
jgi:hypothetical protein